MTATTVPDESAIKRVNATVLAFGLPSEQYINALDALLALDNGVKRRSAARYLDVILEILFRLQDNFEEPFLEPMRSERLRNEVNRLLAELDDEAVSNAARDVLENLP